MRKLFHFCVLPLLLVLSGRHSVVRARIAEDNIERDGRGIILLAEPFGFGSDGHLNLEVSNLELHRSNVDTNLQGFFITSSQVSEIHSTRYSVAVLVCSPGNKHLSACVQSLLRRFVGLVRASKTNVDAEHCNSTSCCTLTSRLISCCRQKLSLKLTYHKAPAPYKQKQW